MGAQKKIHFVTSIPSPYQLDFFNALERHVPGEFTVTFSAAQEVDRQYYYVPEKFDFDARILSNEIRQVGKDYHSSAGLADALDNHPSRDVVIGGNYFMPDARTARRCASRAGHRFFFWGENPFKRQDTGIKKWCKELYLRWYLGVATGVIGIGRAATDHYRRLANGRPGENIPYAPNLDGLLEPNESVREKAKTLRASSGVGNGVLVLYAGSLIERKDPATLLRAFAEVVKRGHDCRLLLAGEGPLRAELESLVADRQLIDRVTFLGFVRGEELQAAYQAADLFVLPTAGHEGWGVVVQEAMAAGLPLIASKRVGAAVDMLERAEAGMLFEAGDAENLASCIEEVVTHPERRCKMGEVARDTARNTGADSAAQRLIEFLESTQ